jgi:hypothetical protein
MYMLKKRDTPAAYRFMCKSSTFEKSIEISCFNALEKKECIKSEMMRLSLSVLS